MLPGSGCNRVEHKPKPLRVPCGYAPLVTCRTNAEGNKRDACLLRYGASARAAARETPLGSVCRIPNPEGWLTTPVAARRSPGAPSRPAAGLSGRSRLTPGGCGAASPSPPEPPSRQFGGRPRPPPLAPPPSAQAVPAPRPPRCTRGRLGTCAGLFVVLVEGVRLWGGVGVCVWQVFRSSFEIRQGKTIFEIRNQRL